MYNDFRNVNRDSWKYVYRGSNLLPFAKKKFQEYLEKEKEARAKMVAYMSDIKVSQSEEKVADAKNSVTTNGSLREQCAVFVHEFTRTPEREFHLSLSDVVFFGIIPDPE